METTITNTAELRRFLLSKMEEVAEGTLTPQAAKAVTSLAQQVHNSLRLEVDMARFVSDKATQPKGVRPLSLDG